MISNIKSILAGLVLGTLAAVCVSTTGCGAYDDQGIEPTDDSGELGSEQTQTIELGTVKQAYVIGNGGYGWTTAATRFACAQPGVAGQNCNMPGQVSHAVKWCFKSGFGSDAATGVRSGVATADANATGWTFTEVGDDYPNGSCKLRFSTLSTDPTGPTLVARIEDFRTLASTNSALITSPAGTGHVNGTWHDFKGLEVNYNWTKAAAQGPLVDRFYGVHVGGDGAGKFMGLGTQTSGSYNSSWSREFVSITPPTTFTSGELCRVNGLDSHGPGTFSALFGCGI